jgi:NADH-quinone oxidoreductase subunit H
MRIRAAVLFCAASAGALLAVGCQGEVGPDLVSVNRLDPERAAAGDRVLVAGEGFPEGRAATVTFRGDLFRPGAAPERDVRITAKAVAAGRNALAIAFDGDLERRFAGAGEQALHTTFRGDVRVAFQPDAHGLAPVAGTAREVRFEVLPSVEGPLAEEQKLEGARALAFLGIGARPDPATRGLDIATVDPDGRAARGGLRPGDLLLSVDGVTALSPSDVRVRGGERTARFMVEREGRPIGPLPVDVDGLAPLGAADIVPAACLVLFACALLVLPVTRVGSVLKWLARFLEQPRGSSGTAHAFEPSRLLEALLPPVRDGRALGVAAAFSFAAIGFGFAWIASGHPIASPDVDLAAVTLGVSGALVATRFVDGGRRSSGFSLVAALAAALRTLSCVLPALVATFGAVLASGRFVLGELVSEQGGLPWSWAGFRNPGLAVCLSALLASTIPEVGNRRGAPFAEGLSDAVRAAPTTSRALVRLAEWTYLWAIAGLGVALFLGGWRVPGTSSVAEEASRAMTALGVVVFFAKLWCVVLSVGAVRSLVGRVLLEHVARLSFGFLLPVSIGGLVLALGWATAMDGAHSSVLADLSAYTVLLCLASAAAWVVGARLHGSRRAVPSVNPWI